MYIKLQSHRFGIEGDSMGQPLLHVGMSSPTTSGDKQIFSDRAANQQDKEVKPFSSTLNEQLEKPSEAQENNKKPAESASDKHVNGKAEAKSETKPETEVEGKITVKAEEKDKKSGNDLPSDSELVDIEQSEDKTDNRVVISDKNVDIVEDLDREGAETASVDLAAVAPTIAQTTSEAKPQTATVKGKESQTYSSRHSNREQVIVASKATQSDAMKVDELSDETVVAKPVLRSDILHAIIKKQDPSINKSKPSIAISKELPVMAEKQPEIQISDRQKMTQMLSATKSDGLILKPAQERASSTFSPSAVLAPTTSISSTLAPQTPSVAQSVLMMQPSVQSEAWGKVLSSRVVWMAREGVQQAQLRLNPANLGPVEVKLHMNNDQVNVSFVAQHAATRDALEQALPRLRESLQENGMNLTDADVSDQTSEQESEEDSDDTSSNKQALTLDSDDNELEQAPSESNELEVGVSVFA